MNTKSVFRGIEKADKNIVLKSLPIDLSMIEEMSKPLWGKQRILGQVVQNISNHSERQKSLSYTVFDEWGEGVWEYFPSYGNVYVNENTFKILGFTAAEKKSGFNFFISRLQKDL